MPAVGRDARGVQEGVEAVGRVGVCGALEGGGQARVGAYEEDVRFCRVWGDGVWEEWVEGGGFGGWFGGEGVALGGG